VPVLSGLPAGNPPRGLLPIASFVTRLVWLSLLPLLVLASWLALVQVLDARAELRSRAAALARNYASAIDHDLEARIDALRMLAASPLADDPRRWKELYAEAQGFRESFGSHVIFADAGQAPRMLFNTRVPFGAEMPLVPLPKGRSAAREALTTGKPAVGDIVLGPIAKERLVAIAVPGLRKGHVASLLLATFEVSRFQEQLGRLLLPSPAWAIRLQDGRGEPIAGRLPPGFEGSRDADEGGRFVARSRLSAWSVTVEVPRAVLRHPVLQAGAALGAGLFVATLVGLLGGTLVGRRLARAVGELAEPPSAPSRAGDILEIAAARDRLDEAARDRQIAISALHESEERFRRLFQESPLGMGFVGMDGRLLAINASFVRTLGYGLEDLPDLDAWWVRAYPDPAYRKAVEVGWAEAMERAAVRGEGMASGEFFVRCKDGEDRSVVISRIVLEDGVLATFFDVTERNRAVAALRESEERLQLFIQYAPVALAMFDREMRYLAVSRRWLEEHRLERGEVLGHRHEEFHRETAREWRAAHDRALRGEVVRADEDRYTAPDGGTRWRRWEMLPWNTGDGAVGGTVLFSEDITSRKLAEEEVARLTAGLEQRVAERTAELTAANQELDAFGYAISHDLRAPLRAMDGYSHILLEDHGAEFQGPARALLEQISNASRRMGELIDAILALSRNARGEPRRETVDLSALARHRLGERAAEDPSRRVAVEVEEGLSATGDPQMLEAALGNLLDNAWKYSARAASPAIRVFSEERDGHRWFCVADNGAGFDMDHAARLFQPFQRLHRQDEFPGVGVGLATVKRIIYRHGGTIEARGERGKGATFRFTIPDAGPQERGGDRGGARPFVIG